MPVNIPPRINISVSTPPPNPGGEDVAPLSGIRRDVPERTLFWEAKVQIGSGSFGKVYRLPSRHVPKKGRGENDRVVLPDRSEVAVKVIPKVWLQIMTEIVEEDGGEAKKDYFAQLETEVASLRMLSHPACVKLFDVFQTDPPEGADPEEDQGEIFLVQEFFDGMPLDRFLEERGWEWDADVSEAICGTVLGQLASCLQFVHGMNIAHRDIKPENVLVGPQTLQVKLIDFGLAKVFCPKHPRYPEPCTPHSFLSLLSGDIEGVSSYGGSSRGPSPNPELPVDCDTAAPSAPSPGATAEVPRPESWTWTRFSHPHSPRSPAPHGLGGGGGGFHPVGSSSLMPPGSRASFGASFDPGSPTRSGHSVALTVSRRVIGTAEFVAPEVVHSIDTTGYTPKHGTPELVKKCDAFAFGVVCYWMLTGKMPFYSSDPEKYIAEVEAGPQFDGPGCRMVTEEGRDFVRGLLRSDPKLRQNCTQATNHPWLKSREKSWDSRLKGALAGNGGGDEVLPPFEHPS